MKQSLFSFLIVFFFTSFHQVAPTTAWIRINQLGYAPKGAKVAVWCSKENVTIKTFQLVDAVTNKTVFSSNAGKTFGAYGPFTQTYRLNFSSFIKQGVYYLQAGNTKSPEFKIADDAYKGAADFCLRYMRQQRSGFNPFLKDSCHTHDGYVLYGEKAGIKDSTHIDVVGGWHDASDYLQYSTTSANATYHLLMAYRDFKNVFADEKLANGLDGKNGMADVLDEAKWGLNWLLKMHPRDDWMFNQIADDRDHMGMRIPKEDSFYGRGYERPVYFISGEPQQRGKFMNNTTGTSSTAGKFASVFALAHYLLTTDSVFRKNDNRGTYYDKAFSAYNFGLKKKGTTQTASVRSPYIYAEDNWTDDMELAAAILHSMVNNNKGSGDNGYYLVAAIDYAKEEKITPWLGADTAKHYQWYPFINLGHYELIKQLQTKKNGPSQRAGYYKSFVQNFWNNTDTITGYYKEGIQKVWNRARQNAFFRGIPYIWCSNNLTTSFAIQCYWYRQLTGDKTFSELEQANFDWLFGCNPWGTSFVYGLPAIGDTPVDPHSAFTHLRNYPIDGGLVDGPVYGSIYKNLIGITLYQPDEYAEFQSELAVYHDDYGDYSTNEPTMDGTASLIYLLAAKESETKAPSKSPPTGKTFQKKYSYDHGAIVRGDSMKKQIALVFTGDEFADGGSFISKTLKQQNIKASFFFTGRFYENPAFQKIIQQLKKDENYLGPHSNQHLLYCDWNNRDSLLITKSLFLNDLKENLDIMYERTINTSKVKYFLPPYEWYNDSIALWTKFLGLQLVNYTPGTLSHADYTTPVDKKYYSSEIIYNSIINYEQSHKSGLNGFILLMHVGTDPKRTDKFYHRLPQLLNYLKQKGYQFKTVNEFLI
ncbi:MAG TPA: glycoside hydrolase family 9 protein [Chitinophagaceae bacterium]|jgi:peptidoglycan/xylan/chitin deacetylase (PgdA/CDA1 family)|nr:glycoside hydrolase family 9 protein [Chitinophagaceae bacterium]